MTREMYKRAEDKSLEELRCFYCQIWGVCEVEKRDYVEHIVRYLVMYLKFHKINPKMRIKAYQILSFLDYTVGQDL